MSSEESFSSKHFDLQELAEGVYAAIHKPGGDAFSNAGIIDLGGKTLVIDSFDSVAAGRELRQTSESLFNRSIHSLVLTHVHSDHWIGATQFDNKTTYIASQKTANENKRWGKALLKDFQNPEEWDEWLAETEDQIRLEKDERVRAGLQISLDRTRTTMSEMQGYQPRYPDTMLQGTMVLEGSTRVAEIRSFGAGHSRDDVAVLLSEDRIVFLGDIGFFHTQPFMGFCNLDKWRKQMQYFHDSDFLTFVPGHGPVGTVNDLKLQLEYFDILEELVRGVLNKGGSLEEAMQINLPEPFDSWLYGGMARFEVNVEYVYKQLGGKGP